MRRGAMTVMRSVMLALVLCVSKGVSVEGRVLSPKDYRVTGFETEFNLTDGE
jgi:hypothetical protein